MNIHEDIEREAMSEYKDDVGFNAYILGATAERVKGMAFAEWCSVNRYDFLTVSKEWTSVKDLGKFYTTSELFQIFLQNEK